MASNEFLERTALFHKAAVTCIASVQPEDGERSVAAYQCALMSIEHASGMLALLSMGLPNAALALLRPQFETLVRGVWLLNAADEKWVRQFHEPLTATTESADRLPGVTDMFNQLAPVESPDAQAVVSNLDQYRSLNWYALNSFTHGGKHPMSRSAPGYSEDLATNVVRNANGLVCLATQLTAILSGDPGGMETARKLHGEYRDCLPLA